MFHQHTFSYYIPVLHRHVSPRAEETQETSKGEWPAISSPQPPSLPCRGQYAMDASSPAPHLVLSLIHSFIDSFFIHSFIRQAFSHLQQPQSLPCDAYKEPERWLIINGAGCSQWKCRVSWEGVTGKPCLGGSRRASLKADVYTTYV